MGYLRLMRDFFRLRGNVRKSRTEIEQIQQKKLRNMLMYAYNNSPYYRAEFEKHKITCSNIDTAPVSAFPTMDKAALLENFDALVTDPQLRQEDLRRFDTEEKSGLYLDKYHVVHSSGSTGKPGYFVYDEAAWNQMLLGIIRGALWGLSTKDILKLLSDKPRMAYIAATDGRYGGALAVGDGIDSLRAEQLFLDVNMPLTEWVSGIEEFRPNIIIGYPSAIKILAGLMKEGKVKPCIRHVVSCGEPLSLGMRAYLEKAFGVKVVNFYGASESLALGAENDAVDGMYLFDDLNYIEVENGAMYLTCLYNFVQPIIRYRVSDQLVLKAPDKNAACPFTRAKSLLGRDEDLLWFTDEKGKRDFLHPLSVEGFCIEGLRDYQFCQTGADSFEMIAEVPDMDRRTSVETELAPQLQKILREKRLDYVRYHLKFTERIAPDPLTGKKRLVLPLTQAGGVT